MDDWQNEVLLLSGDIVPPAFMCDTDTWDTEAEDQGLKLETTSAVIKRHFEEIRKLLEEEGYGDLTRMADRLEERVLRLEDRSETLGSRLLYLNTQHNAYRDRFTEFKSSFEDREFEVRGSVREAPIGRTWLDQESNEMKFFEENAWEVDLEGDNDTLEETLPSMRVSYHPTEENVDPDLQVFSVDFDAADLHTSDTLVFTGDTTWKEVFDQFGKRLRSLTDRKGKLRRTRELLRFRHGIAETVLYQVEAFGDPKEMTDENARRIAANDHDGTVETPKGWEKNAAMMYAYFCNHDVPENMGEIDEIIASEGLLDSFSYEHAWKTLKNEGWASSSGDIQALVEALERWAERFEDKYGEEKANLAADPFNWPSHDN